MENEQGQALGCLDIRADRDRGVLDGAEDHAQAVAPKGTAMSRGEAVLWTPEEDAILWSVVGGLDCCNWVELLARLTPLLPGRSRNAIAARAAKLRRRALAKELRLKREWPSLGTKLFADDPRAVRDHGSARRLELPPLRSSGCSSSASWVVGGGT